MTLPAPAQVMAAINTDAANLDTASKELFRAIEERGEAQAAYDHALNAELIRIRDEAHRLGERLPAEDLRKAIAHGKIDRSVYADFLTATAKVEAMKARTRAISDAMSGRQSLLAAMRDEARAAA